MLGVTTDDNRCRRPTTERRPSAACFFLSFSESSAPRLSGTFGKESSSGNHRPVALWESIPPAATENRSQRCMLSSRSTPPIAAPHQQRVRRHQRSTARKQLSRRGPDTAKDSKRVAPIRIGVEDSSLLSSGSPNFGRLLAFFLCCGAGSGKIARLDIIAENWRRRMSSDVSVPSPLVDLSCFFGSLGWAAAFNGVGRQQPRIECKVITSRLEWCRDLAHAQAVYTAARTVEWQGRWRVVAEES